MTIYTARIRYRHDGREAVLGFDSATTRELQLLMMETYVQVLERGVIDDSQTQPELLVPDNGRIH